MKELAELERRISAALTRIGDGLAALPDAHAAEAVSAEPLVDHSAELADLRDALDAERAARIEAEERLAAAVASTAASGDAGRALALQEQVDRLTKLLDVQGLDLVRLRKTVGTLRESFVTTKKIGSRGSQFQDRNVRPLSAAMPLPCPSTISVRFMLPETMITTRKQKPIAIS